MTSFCKSALSLNKKRLDSGQDDAQGIGVLLRRDAQHLYSPELWSVRPRIRNTRSKAAQLTVGIALFALCGVSVASASSAAARWTPVQASSKVGGKCLGVGKPVAGKYVAFKCKKGGTVFAKVRPDGRVLCYSRVSLAAISKACLTVPGATIPAGSIEEAREAAGLAIAKRFDPTATFRYQAFLPECSGGKGHYVCSGEGTNLSMSARVDWTKSGPVVTFTSFVCKGSSVGRPGC